MSCIAGPQCTVWAGCPCRVSLGFECMLHSYVQNNSCFSQAFFLSFVHVKLPFFLKNCDKEENGKFRLLSFFLKPDIKIASTSACRAVVFLLNVHPPRHVGSFERERGEYRKYTNVARKWKNNQVCL